MMIDLSGTDPVRSVRDARVFPGRGPFEHFELGQHRLLAHVQQSFAVQAEDVDAVPKSGFQARRWFVGRITPARPHVGLDQRAKVVRFRFRHRFNAQLVRRR
jgi:hypothetical protein